MVQSSRDLTNTFSIKVLFDRKSEFTLATNICDLKFKTLFVNFKILISSMQEFEMYISNSCMLLMSILKLTNSVLNLRSQMFVAKVNSDFLSNKTLIENVFVRSRLDCTIMCVNNKHCCSAAYSFERICSFNSCCHPETKIKVNYDVIIIQHSSGKLLI